MRRKLNWPVILGVFLIFGGAAIAWGNYLFNLPSPFDIASAPGQNDSFLPVIAPASSGSGTPAPAAPTIGAGETHSTSFPAQSQPVGLIPDRLVIPSIKLDAPIVSVDYKTITIGSQVYTQWLAPDQLAVGWQDSSALLGLPGNTVLNGHHNAFGMVFKNLVRLNMGDLIIVYSGSQEFQYQVVAKMLLPERYAPLEARLENARWIATSQDERLTLITCWPADNNTHRVVVVAVPIGNTNITSVSDQAPQSSQSLNLSIRGSVAESSYTVVGDKLHYSYLVTNTGNDPITGVGVISDISAIACPKTDLAPAESMICTATYGIKDPDTSLEKIINTANASGLINAVPVQSNVDTQTVVHFIKLILSAVCAVDPNANNGWQVVNNNPYLVDFEYAINRGVAGVGTIQANSTTIYETPINSGTGVMSLYVGGLPQNNARVASGCH